MEATSDYEEGATYHVADIIEFCDGKILKETRYYAEPVRSACLARGVGRKDVVALRDKDLVWCCATSRPEPIRSFARSVVQAVHVASLVQAFRAFLQESHGSGEICSLTHRLPESVGVLRNYRPSRHRRHVAGGIGGNCYACVNGQDLDPEQLGARENRNDHTGCPTVLPRKAILRV